MPYRKVPLRNGFIYHVYDQGIDRRDVFLKKLNYRRFLTTLKFYQFDQNFISLAKYLEKGSDQLLIQARIRKQPKQITVLAYCLMPNHFHIVIRQELEGGISRYIGKVLNSYTKYFNIQNKRKGSLFLNPFRAVRVETEEQLLHLVRYVHLNPFSGGITRSIEGTVDYPYSSLALYFDPRPREGMVDTNLIGGLFKNLQQHKEFVFDQADYQKRLEAVKHLTLEDELD